MKKFDPDAKLLYFSLIFSIGYYCLTALFILPIILVAGTSLQDVLSNRFLFWLFVIGSILVIWIIWAIISQFWGSRIYGRLGYEVKREGIEFQSGIFKKRKVFIPFKEIAAVEEEEERGEHGGRHYSFPFVFKYALKKEQLKRIRIFLNSGEREIFRGLNKKQADEICQVISKNITKYESRKIKKSILSEKTAKHPILNWIIVAIFLFLGTNIFFLILLGRPQKTESTDRLRRSLLGLNGWKQWLYAEGIIWAIVLGLIFILVILEILRAKIRKSSKK